MESGGVRLVGFSSVCQLCHGSRRSEHARTWQNFGRVVRQVSRDDRLVGGGLATIDEDWAAKTFLHVARPDFPALETLCEEAARRHTARPGFRTYDILHVAMARPLGYDRFLVSISARVNWRRWRGWR